MRRPRPPRGCRAMEEEEEEWMVRYSKFLIYIKYSFITQNKYTYDKHNHIAYH
jgi:hypothetical protein